jgi:UDP-N-acetylglucosamine/UDP-N-acetylgalactosamine diphosphorylase
MATEAEVKARLEEQGQQHVLRWVDELDDDERTRFMAQLAALDLGRLEEFRLLLGTPPTDISFEDVLPAPVERLPLDDAGHDFETQVTQSGRKALEADRVAALTAAGGQGTRLRYDHPKGMFPISPVRGKSLFEWFAEHILDARRR